MRKVRLDPTGTRSRVFVTLLRLGMTAGFTFGVALITTLVLAIADLYLSGHGYPSLTQPVLAATSAGDLLLLGAAAGAAIVFWWVSGRMRR